jgi:bidirectional [NiFe] hydrogenase diaphorase subunit
MMLEELQEIARAEKERQQGFTRRIHVCTAAACLSQRSDQVKAGLEAKVKESGLEKSCMVKGVGCMGLCAAGPLVSVEPSEVLYQGVRPPDENTDVSEIVSSLHATPVDRLQLSKDVPFFRSQKKIVLENSGTIDPERIEDYVAAGGYEALLKAITSMSPMEVIDQVSKSGLRGRGGAGYPTGLKWSTVAKARANGGVKYVICNADEGDPGAFMDRSVLESFPMDAASRRHKPVAPRVAAFQNSFWTCRSTTNRSPRWVQSWDQEA